MIFPGPTRSHRLHYAAEVWAAIASGLGGRRFESLRDRRSLAYTVMATSWQRGRAGALATYIATSPEREPEARGAMLDDLERFGREPVSEAELDQARHYLAGQAEVDRQHGSSVAGEILEAWLIGAGLDDLTDPAARFRAVTAEEVLEVTGANLRRELRCEGVVRGGAPRTDGRVGGVAE
jgi:zinc protease